MRRYSHYTKGNESTRIKKDEIIDYQSSEIFAAAVAAFRVNHKSYFRDLSTVYGEIVDGKVIKCDTVPVDFYLDSNKLVEPGYTGLGIRQYVANKTLVRKFIKAPDENITEADRQEGQQIQNYWREKISLILSGAFITDYIKNCIDVASKEIIKSNDAQAIGFIASLPNNFEQNLKRDKIRENKDDAQLASSHFGVIGDKFVGDVTVLSCRFSRKWGINFIDALHGKNMVMWASKNTINVDSKVNISGKIKNHFDNNVTQLHYVKVTM